MPEDVQSPGSPAPSAAPATAPASPAAPAATESTSTATPGPASALDAVRSAADRISKAAPSAAPGADGQPPAEGVVPPVAPVVDPTAQPVESEGIRNLRTAYEALKGKVGWADSLKREDVESALALIADMRRDPVAFYRQLSTELTADPNYAKALQPAAKTEEDPEPGPDLFTEVNGQRMELYSAKQQKAWRDWNDKRTEAKLDQRLNPLQQWHQTAEQEAQRQDIIRGAQTTASEVMKDMRENYPHFTGNEEKVAAYLAKIPAETKRRIGSIAALHVAYTQFLKADVFPSLDKKAEDRIRKEFGIKAATASGVKPGSGAGTVAAKKSPTNVSELSQRLKQLSEAGAAT